MRHFHRQPVTAFRLVNGDADGLSGVTVDWFDGVAVASLYRSMPESEQEALVGSLRELEGLRSIYVKHRPREARRVANTRKSELAPEAPLYGPPVEEKVILENGLSFLIRPSQGLSVGLYLDMREVRQRVRQLSRGARVLNCFAYTCAFSVAARAGNAERVLNVDLSSRVLSWGKENARANGQSVSDDDYLPADVLERLPLLVKRGETFDGVVLDPPSFATSKRRTFSAASHYGRLVELAAPLVRRGGWLLACCNMAKLSPDRFEAQIRAGLASCQRRGEVKAKWGSPATDFPTLPGHPSPLKAWKVEL